MESLQIRCSEVSDFFQFHISYLYFFVEFITHFCQAPGPVQGPGQAPEQFVNE